MAMGIVSNEVLEKELERNGLKEGEYPIIGIKSPKGRGQGSLEVPDSLRKVIAEDSISNGRESALELAKSIGISPSSVSAYANGSTSTSSYGKRDNELVRHNNQVKERIAGKARSRLLAALHNITPDKLKTAKLKEVASVARDMSAIIRNMEPTQAQEDSEKAKTQVNVVIYSPARKQESDYRVMNVNE